MTATAERIENYELIHGREKVEQFLDAVLSIQEHIDPSIMEPSGPGDGKDDERTPAASQVRKTPYDDLWSLDKSAESNKQLPAAPATFPPKPEKDVLLFIEEYSRELDDWQRDILTMMREEMRYFWPQLETKIMNEGWASFWHQRILREMDLTPEEAVEFASLNASVVQPSKQQINPYYLGVKMFEDIEARYNNPTEEMQRLGVEPGSGREKIFEVREIESDISFIRNYLTKDLVQQEDMYLFEKQGSDYTITDKEYEQVRGQLITQRVNGGFPYITVENGDYMRNGELYLMHGYEGTELDLHYLERPAVYSPAVGAHRPYGDLRGR